MLLYPAVYYIVFPSPRYRVPIEPEMTILAVYLVAEARTNSKAFRPSQSSERESA